MASINPVQRRSTTNVWRIVSWRRAIYNRFSLLCIRLGDNSWWSIPFSFCLLKREQKGCVQLTCCCRWLPGWINGCNLWLQSTMAVRPLDETPNDSFSIFQGVSEVSKNCKSPNPIWVIKFFIRNSLSLILLFWTALTKRKGNCFSFFYFRERH